MQVEFEFGAMGFSRAHPGPSKKADLCSKYTVKARQGSLSCFDIVTENIYVAKLLFGGVISTN